jgi:AraC family transcriptional regulator of adaptative response/methylated-DNA-[protein]-cysteine methyltransferase
METATVSTARFTPPKDVSAALRDAHPSDYAVVSRAIEFISRKWRDQPSLETIAAHVGMKPLSLQRLFTRWAGLSPKGFPRR